MMENEFSKEENENLQNFEGKNLLMLDEDEEAIPA